MVSDNVAIGKAAADHLLECGLKNFAFVGPMDLAHKVDRLEGFSQAVTAAGHTCTVCEIEFVQRRRELDEQSVVDTRRLGRQLQGQTTMPITQVALNSGYQSSTGFSVAFRKETGMSPREYRKQWRGG